MENLAQGSPKRFNCNCLLTEWIFFTCSSCAVLRFGRLCLSVWKNECFLPEIGALLRLANLHSIYGHITACKISAIGWKQICQSTRAGLSQSSLSLSLFRLQLWCILRIENMRSWAWNEHLRKAEWVIVNRHQLTIFVSHYCWGSVRNQALGHFCSLLRQKKSLSCLSHSKNEHTSSMVDFGHTVHDFASIAELFAFSSVPPVTSAKTHSPSLCYSSQWANSTKTLCFLLRLPWLAADMCSGHTRSFPSNKPSCPRAIFNAIMFNIQAQWTRQKSMRIFICWCTQAQWAKTLC